MTENVMKLAVRNNKKSNVKTYPSRTWMKNKMNDPYLFDEENVEEVFSIKPLKPSFLMRILFSIRFIPDWNYNKD